VSAAGGWLQGGGLSSTSRKYGLGVDNALQFEVVLADGSQVVADACSHPELFWALRGGGGGTFGVVTAAVHRLHAVEPIVSLDFGLGWWGWANPPQREAFVDFWVAESPHLDARWGGYWSAGTLSLQFVGSEADARATFIDKLDAWVAAHAWGDCEHLDFTYDYDPDDAPDGTTLWENTGWCYSDLDFGIGCATTPADCWALCEAKYGDELVAIDFYLSGECSCQDDCAHQEDCQDDNTLVITRDSVVGPTLPDCEEGSHGSYSYGGGSRGSYSYSYSYDRDDDNDDSSDGYDDRVAAPGCVDGLCYAIFDADGENSPALAEAKCQLYADGGHAAKIGTAAQAAFLFDYLEETIGDDEWWNCVRFGAVRDASYSYDYGPWRWTDGTDVAEVFVHENDGDQLCSCYYMGDHALYDAPCEDFGQGSYYACSAPSFPECPLTGGAVTTAACDGLRAPYVCPEAECGYAGGLWQVETLDYPEWSTLYVHPDLAAIGATATDDGDALERHAVTMIRYAASRGTYATCEAFMSAHETYCGGAGYACDVAAGCDIAAVETPLAVFYACTDAGPCGVVPSADYYDDDDEDERPAPWWFEVDVSSSYYDLRGGADVADPDETSETGGDWSNLGSRLVPRDWVVDEPAAAKALILDLAHQGGGGSNYFLGGAMADVAADATAVHPAQRSAIWNIMTTNDEAHDLVRAALPNDRTGVCYSHHAQLEPDWRDAAWGANYDRLLAAKATYDPDNRFNCWHCVGYVGPEMEQGDEIPPSFMHGGDWVDEAAAYCHRLDEDGAEDWWDEDEDEDELRSHQECVAHCAREGFAFSEWTDGRAGISECECYHRDDCTCLGGAPANECVCAEGPLGRDPREYDADVCADAGCDYRCAEPGIECFCQEAPGEFVRGQGTPMSWDDCRASCEAMGLAMPCITKKRQSDALVELVTGFAAWSAPASSLPFRARATPHLVGSASRTGRATGSGNRAAIPTAVIGPTGHRLMMMITAPSR